MKQLNIPGLTQEDVKLKIKSIRSRHSSELAKVQLKKKNVVLAETISVYRNYSGSNQADLFLRSVDFGIDCLVHFRGTV